MAPQGIHLLGTGLFSDLAEALFLENITVHSKRNFQVTAAEQPFSVGTVLNQFPYMDTQH